MKTKPAAMKLEKCTRCAKPSPVLIELEPGPGPTGKEPCRLCPKCWKE